MSGCIVFKGQRFSAYLRCVCCALLMMLTAGCGDEGSNTNQKPEDNITAAESGTGSAVFSVQWHPASNNPAAAAALTSQLAGEDCTTVGVVTITCELYDESGNLIASGGPWNCDDHEGVIYRIPPGPNITFAVLGWGDADQISLIYHGQRTGITIAAGATKDVGTIDAYEIVPADLSATGVSNSQIDLAWTVPSGIIGAIAGYRIYRDGAPHATAATTSYSDTDLDPMTEYCYTVSAYDAYGNESIQSDQVCASTNENQAPSASITEPEDGTAVDQGDSVTFSGTGEDPEDGTLTGDDLVWTSNIDGQIGTGNTFATTTLSAGVHTITLTATDRQGGYDSASITLTVNDAEAPTVPGDLQATGVSSTQIDLIWTASTDNVGVAGYRIYRNGAPHATVTTTSYSDTDLDPITEYCYTVSAYDAYGNESVQSDQACASTNENQTPSVNITAPADGTDVDQGDSVTFSGTAEDPEDGTLTGDALVWTSTIDGQIGTGNTFATTTLSAGVHTITLTATDPDGAYASASIALTVNDTEAPAVPGGLAASPQGGTRIDLSWTASTDNVGVTGYRIYRDDVAVGTSASTTYSDTGLDSATEYCYRVTAYDAAGNESGQSAQECATTEDTIAPSVPTGLTATPIGGSRIDLSWTASTDNVGVTGYRIYRDGVAVGTSASTTYSDTGLDSATEYCYTVTAYDAAGNESGQSAQECATTEDTIAPSVPTGLTATPIGGSRIDLSWNASTDNVGVTGYRIYRDGVAVGTSASTTYSDTGLNPAIEYCYTVTAYDAAGNESGPSAQVCRTTGDTIAPSVPTGLTATPIGGSRIDLSWSASTDNVGVTGYRIYRDGVAVGTSASTTYSDTGLDSATEYCYTVTAYDAAGNESGQSAQECATTGDTIAPSVPTGLTGLPRGGSRIDLSWNASSDNVGVTGYRIYRDGVAVGTSASTTYSDTGLNSATRYCYTVTAYDAAGNESGQSAETCVTTEDTIPPSVPGNLTATAVSDSQIDLSWSASTDNVGVALYRIYRDGTSIDSTSSTTYSDSGLSSATEYCYTVTAVDSAGNESGHSNQACDTTDQIEVNVLFLNLFIDITDQNGDGYSELAAHLQEMGFHVAQTNLTAITAAALSGYDIVVFGGDIDRSISTGEADVIRGFAQNGGGLLLLGDQGLEQWSTTLFQDLHLVTRPDGSGSWGIAFNADLLCDDGEEDYCDYCATANDPDGGVDYPFIRTTTTHPATSGVDVFVYNWGTSLRVDTGIARTLAASSTTSWGDTNAVYIDDYDEYYSVYDEGYEVRRAYPAMAVVEPGQGRVIALGDNGVWFNIWFYRSIIGTQNLATSVFTYLSGQ